MTTMTIEAVSRHRMAGLAVSQDCDEEWKARAALPGGGPARTPPHRELTASTRFASRQRTPAARERKR